MIICNKMSNVNTIAPMRMIFAARLSKLFTTYPFYFTPYQIFGIYHLRVNAVYFVKALRFALLYGRISILNKLCYIYLRTTTYCGFCCFFNIDIRKSVTYTYIFLHIFIANGIKNGEKIIPSFLIQILLLKLIYSPFVRQPFHSLHEYRYRKSRIYLRVP